MFACYVITQKGVKGFCLKAPATRSEKLVVDDTSTDSNSSPTIVFNTRTLAVLLNKFQFKHGCHL